MCNYLEEHNPKQDYFVSSATRMIKDFLSYNLVVIILTDNRFDQFRSFSNMKTGFEVPYLAHFYFHLSESCRDDVCVSQVNQTLTHKHPFKNHNTGNSPPIFKKRMCLQCDPQTRALVWWVRIKTAGQLLLLSLKVSQCVDTLRTLRIKYRQQKPFTGSTPHRNKWQCWCCSSSEQSDTFVDMSFNNDYE